MGKWRDNGEKKYYDTSSPLKRARQWLVWIGGWEHPWIDDDIYGTYFSTHWPDGLRAGPTPISLLGHRITFFGWGIDINFWRHPYWYFVISGFRTREPLHIYVSRDGTPPRKGEPGGYLWGNSNGRG